MKAVKTAFDEILGLFVDDWWFAGLVILWVVIFVLCNEIIPTAIRAWVLPLPLAILVLYFVVIRTKAAK